MKTKSQDTIDLPADLAALLAETPPLTPEVHTRLERAAAEADQDPQYHANYLKGLFVEELRQALEAKDISQSELARRMGCSRQYLSKLFAEDKRVNFTLDTLCALAHQAGRRVHLLVLPEGEAMHVLRYDKPRSVDPIPDGIGASPNRIYTADNGYNPEQFLSTAHPYAYDQVG